MENSRFTALAWSQDDDFEFEEDHDISLSDTSVIIDKECNKELDDTSVSDAEETPNSPGIFNTFQAVASRATRAVMQTHPDLPPPPPRASNRRDVRADQGPWGAR